MQQATETRTPRGSFSNLFNEAATRPYRLRTVSRSSSSESLLSEDLSCRARSLFFTLDKDGSGFIEPFELAECCSELSQIELDDLFEKLDNDGDGRISIRDFREGFRKISQTLMRHNRRHKARAWSQSGSTTPPSNASLDKDVPPSTSDNEAVATPTPKRVVLPKDKSEDKEDTCDYLDHLADGFAALSW